MIVLEETIKEETIKGNHIRFDIPIGEKFKYKDNYYQDISEFISDLEQEVKRVNQVETTSIELDNKPKKNLLSIFK